MKVLASAMVGLAAVTALTVPGAVYMSNAQRPIIKPTERVTVTVPGPTVTATRWETVTETEQTHEHVTEYVTEAPIWRWWDRDGSAARIGELEKRLRNQEQREFQEDAQRMSRCLNRDMSDGSSTCR